MKKITRMGLGAPLTMVVRSAAMAAAAALLGGSFSPAQAVIPIMHNSSSVGSSYWGGGWGNTANSKYGKFTCSTCHTTGLIGGGTGLGRQVRTTITSANSPTDSFPGSAVVLGSYTSFGKDTSHTTSTSICEVCHTQTSHHRYNNTGYAGHNGSVDCNNNGACHVHSNGFAKPGGESSGGSACGGCHGAGATTPALYLNATTAYSTHNKFQKLSYRHFMSSDATTNSGGNGAAVGTLGKSSYYNDVPDALNSNLAARRCLMCHVDHDQFKPGMNAGNKRAYNLRGSATTTPTSGTRSNDDANLCLSCHNSSRTKGYVTADGQVNVPPIPYRTSFANATSLLNASPHGYSVKSAYFRDGSQFAGVCVKCHNDSIGGNGFSALFGNLPKSSVNGQYSTAGRLPRYGSHESTVQSKFAVLGSGFYSGNASGGTSSSLSVAGTPWAGRNWDNYTLTLTKGAGSGGTTPAAFTIYSSSGNTLYLATGRSFSGVPDSSTLFEISNSAPTVDNICFSCHSKGTSYKPFARYSTTDWYGQQYMGSRMASMQSLFMGASGSSSSSKSKTVLSDSTANFTGLGIMAGYQLKILTGADSGQVRAITAVSATQLTVGTGFSSNIGVANYQVLKPSSHPLDSFGRHDSYERETVTVGWNRGDTGIVTTGGSSTQITDSTKLWTGAEFDDNVRRIYFPGKFDSSGNPASSVITGGGAGVVTFAAIPGYTPAANDSYYIGARHVACTDCHNSHAASVSPEGTVTGATATTLQANDSRNVPGWADGKWIGFLIKARSPAGYEQIRYVTGFTLATGTYTVSLAWSSTPTSAYTYEVLLGDKWTNVGGQSGGRAGAGSGGVWGMVPTGWRAPALGSMTTATGYRKIENVYDNLSTIGGSTVAGQRDLCVKCHSSYAFGVNTPMTPSGTASATAAVVNARSTDVTKEFNPNNQAHHAVYARGKNQPIRANYGNLNTGTTSVLSPKWPLATGTLGSIGNGPDGKPGYVTLATGSLPVTALPGWFMYIGSSAPATATPQTATASTGWVEITTIADSSHFYVRREAAVGSWPNVSYNSNITNAGTQAVAMTAGLANAFVPPYGPWSILRCTDCHGSTKTDPVGPHASINKWLIKDADATLSFPWYNAGSVTTVTPNTGMYSIKYFCFNCHRRDVYCDPNLQNPASAALNLGRQTHGVTGLDTNGSTMTVANTNWPQHCRMCHAGDKLGGIHGTNAVNGNTASGSTSNQQGKRFLNGSSWGTFAAGGGGVKRGTTTTAGGCYTANKANSSVDNCGRSHANQAYGSVANYDYDTP